jgi:hypothetical protein
MLYYLVIMPRCNEFAPQAFSLDSLNKETAINDACDIVEAEGYVASGADGKEFILFNHDYLLLEVNERTELWSSLQKRIEDNELENERIEYERLKKKFG